ncbi:unnamed protein product [Cuscuta campestris]|uniref:DUF7903 domain-containing protein n=1 Tax=Cuscuta campestris TaxID=132261 RepID=A0A484MWM8_9ASTE|nr:unnamed protein product [Cuscuta campestris]
MKILIDTPPSAPNLVSTVLEQHIEAYGQASKEESSVDSQVGDEVDTEPEAINKDDGGSNIVGKNEGPLVEDVANVDKSDSTFQEFYTSAGVVIAKDDVPKSVEKVADGDAKQACSPILIDTIKLFELADVVPYEHRGSKKIVQGKGATFGKLLAAMAYIPPHKRHSSCTPAPESHLLPRFRANSSGRNSSGRSTQKVKGSKIVYADAAISKWFAIGLLNTGNEAESSSKFSTLIGFEPVSADSLARKSGETPFALVLKGDAGDRDDAFVECPWDCIVENVKNDLLLSFERVKNEIQENELEEVKPTLVARVGRVLFHGNPPPLESWTESSLRKLKRSFYTNLPSSYVEHITSEIVHKVGLTFEGDKEVYQVKISDNLRPDSTISCKCAVGQDHKSIEHYKACSMTVLW